MIYMSVIDSAQGVSLGFRKIVFGYSSLFSQLCGVGLFHDFLGCLKNNTSRFMVLSIVQCILMYSIFLGFDFRYNFLMAFFYLFIYLFIYLFFSLSPKSRKHFMLLFEYALFKQQSWFKVSSMFNILNCVYSLDWNVILLFRIMSPAKRVPQLVILMYWNVF